MESRGGREESWGSIVGGEGSSNCEVRERDGKVGGGGEYVTWGGGV